MYLKLKAIIVGFIVSAVLFPFLGYLSPLFGGLITGYLVADDYIDGAINGAISATSGGLLIAIFLLYFMARIFGAYSSYGGTSGLVYASFIYVIAQFLVAGLFLGGLGGLAGIFLRDQIEIRTHGHSRINLKNKDNGFLICNTCEGYYKLQEGELPDDFDTNCECGGSLEHTKNVNQRDDPSSERNRNGRKSILKRWSKKSTPMKAVLLVGVMLGVVAVIGLVIFGSNNGIFANNVSMNTTPLTGEQLEAYKASCTEVSVQELMNNPDKYKGQHVKFTGVTYQVFDVNMLSERNEEDAYTLIVGPTTNIKNSVDNPLYVIYKNASSIDQLNMITVYGDVYGTYDRGRVQPVVRINARHVELLKNRDEVINMF